MKLLPLICFNGAPCVTAGLYRSVCLLRFPAADCFNHMEFIRGERGSAVNELTSVAVQCLITVLTQN